MKGYPLGYSNQNLSFSADLYVGFSSSGFSFELGKTGDPFYSTISFSGYSGYIFDQSGDFVGGYKRGQNINISGNYFFGDLATSGNEIVDDFSTGRLSYYINNKLICNNISGPTGFFDTILFEDYDGVNTMSLEVILEDGSPTALQDSDQFYLISSDGYYLCSND